MDADEYAIVILCTVYAELWKQSPLQSYPELYVYM